MKFNIAVFAAASLATLPLSSAHYTFSQLVVNNELVGTDWQYIREHTRGYMPTKGDEILEDDFRCNKDASSGTNTEVYKVNAGDKVGLKQAFGATGMQHPGPTQVYVSKAPNGDVKSYAGDGDWVKVSEGLLCKSGDAEALQTDAWCSWDEDRIEFTVPSTLSSGQYLVRAEHIAMQGAHEGQAEFYYACAQLNVVGDSFNATALTPTVKIPGLYQTSDPAINFSIWSGKATYPDIPGPKVVKGGQTRGSTDGTTTTISTVKRRGLLRYTRRSPLY